MWLCGCGFGLRPGLNASPVLRHGVVEAAYAARGAIQAGRLTFAFLVFFIFKKGLGVDPTF